MTSFCFYFYLFLSSVLFCNLFIILQNFFIISLFLYGNYSLFLYSFVNLFIFFKSPFISLRNLFIFFGISLFLYRKSSLFLYSFVNLFIIYLFSSEVLSSLYFSTKVLYFFNFISNISFLLFFLYSLFIYFKIFTKWSLFYLILSIIPAVCIIYPYNFYFYNPYETIKTIHREN